MTRGRLTKHSKPKTSASAENRIQATKLTSSMNMITGASLLANEKRAFVSFSASPNHCIKRKTPPDQ